MYHSPEPKIPRTTMATLPCLNLRLHGSLSACAAGTWDLSVWNGIYAQTLRSFVLPGRRTIARYWRILLRGKPSSSHPSTRGLKWPCGLFCCFLRFISFLLGAYLLLTSGCYVRCKTRIPESLRPGKFDIWCSSHQIFHIFVVLATVSQLFGIWSAFDYKYTNSVCPASAGTGGQ